MFWSTQTQHNTTGELEVNERKKKRLLIQTKGGALFENEQAGRHGDTDERKKEGGKKKRSRGKKRKEGRTREKRGIRERKEAVGRVIP